ncbi:hypothetical protein [Streptomyces vietnamensis]|uniref:hypothetical protein n=1 Tax=Streptomyces vietnamensis TaxID=362257 RepID=UPI00342A7DE4
MALDRDGYGVIQATRRDSAHRIAYLVFRGSIERGLVIDHTCHTSDTSCPGGSECLHRRCVNPAHLELVEPGENTRRGKSPSALNAQKTHCRHGHQFTPDNTVIRDDGRACRACGRHAAAAYRRRKKEMKS